MSDRGGDYADLDGAYRSYAGEYAHRWSTENPGNRALLAERDRVTRSLLRDDLDRSTRVLDIGAGSAGSFPGLAPHAFAVEADLLLWRVRDGREPRTEAAALCADGCNLPLRSGCVDIVMLATVLSSVDQPTGRRILAEASRALRPGGMILVYDFRVPNPANRHTRPITRRWLRSALPDRQLSIRSVTLAPQIARRLGARTDRWYPRLARLPFLRTHFVLVAR